MRTTKLHLLGLVAILPAASAFALRNEDYGSGGGDDDDVAAYPQITERAVLEKRIDPTAAWVSVNDEGSPAATLTPSMVTKDGSTHLEHAAPHDLTASLFTYTTYAKVYTSTGDIPNPTATSRHGEGAFPRCYNKDGEDAPNCYPYANSSLYVDSIYYITWDPDFFNKTASVPSNGTLEVAVRMDYFNRTKTHSDNGEWQKLDEFDRVPASWGVYPLKIDSSFLRGAYPHNATITLLYAVKGSADKNATKHSVPVMLDKHGLPDVEEVPKLRHQEVAIALPVAFGSIALLVIGGCLWNRKTRRIQLGNVMSRARQSIKKGKRTRPSRGIQLDDQTGRPLYEYRDNLRPEAPIQQRPRSGSDLSDLMGIPTSPVHPGQTGAGTSNANTFRDELDRQREERQHRDWP